MTAPTYIGDGNGTRKKAHLFQKNGDIGLVVYTEPLKTLTPLSVPALSSEFGNQMAQDAAFSGTPDLVHDGIDNIAWTGTNIVGAKVTFNSVAQAHAGTNSVLVNAPSAGHVWQFDKGSNLTVSSYIALTLWIYVDSSWDAGDNITLFGWDTGTGMMIGNEINLEDHFNAFEFSVWQKLSIPLTAMGLTSGTIDAFRMSYVIKDGGAVVFYVDDFQVEEAGGAAEFEVIPPPQTRLRVHKFKYTIIDAYAGTVTGGTMPGLSYDKFLGLTALSGGIDFALVRNGEPVSRASISSLGDAVQAGAEIINHMSDGTNTSVTIVREFVEPIILSSENNDRIRVTINDDLTGLISLTGVAAGATEPEHL